MSRLVQDMTIGFTLTYTYVCLCFFAQDCVTDRLVYLGVQASTCDQSEAVQQCERIPYLGRTH